MTHEYVIGLAGVVPGHVTDDTGGAGLLLPTAIAWAADCVLAVGTDAAVRAISRGDSIFLDLDGCAVTPLPGDPARAARLTELTGATTAPDRLLETLIGAGLLMPGVVLAPGAAADLAFWAPSGAPDGPRSWRLVAVVRGGAFTDGDEHHGPFSEAVLPERTAPRAIEPATRPGSPRPSH